MPRIAVLVVLVALAACSDDEAPAMVADAGADGGGLGRGTVSADAPTFTVEDACERSATAICDKLAACAPFLLKLIYGDAATCAARFRQACLDDARAPGSGATPNALLGCAGSIAGATCEDAVDRAGGFCRMLGEAAAGRACGSDSQCATGLCRKAADQTCGTCATPAAAGEACRESRDCGPTLICSRAQHCAAPEESGAACDDRRPCRPSLGCRSGRCAPFAALGEPCTGEQDCSLWQGHYCHPISKVCLAAKPVEAGEPCGLFMNPVAVCGRSGTCSPNVLNGTCRAPAKDGDPCGPAAGDRTCMVPAVCSQGACRLSSPASCR